MDELTAEEFDRANRVNLTGGFLLARAAADAMEAEGKAAAAANLVIDPYLVPVTLSEAGFPVAKHFRDVMRQKGPSIHPDMGKQADFGPIA